MAIWTVLALLALLSIAVDAKKLSPPPTKGDDKAYPASRRRTIPDYTP